jgi:tripartite-type tricarboxylate transporter receptor subunit TctC
MMMRSSTCCGAVIVPSLALASLQRRRAIRTSRSIVAPSTPGDAPDVIARMAADKLSTASAASRRRQQARPGGRSESVAVRPTATR